MKIYIVNGRKEWHEIAPEGAVEYKAEKKPATHQATQETKAETATKAKKTPANKSRKAGGNK